LKLQKQLIIYFGVTGINAVLSFYITSKLTHLISPEDYGRIYLYSSFLILLAPFVSLGTLNIISVEYFKKPKKEYTLYFSNSQILPILSVLSLLIICFVFSTNLSHFLKVPKVWIYIAPLVVWWIMINDIALILARSKDKAYLYALFSVGRNVLEILIVILLVVAFKHGWQGRLVGAVSAPMLIGIIALLLFFKWGYFVFIFRRKLIKSIFILCLPLIFERLSIFVLTNSDRYFIDHFVKNGTYEVGLYGLGSQIAQIYFLGLMTLNNVYQPLVFKNLAQSKENKLDRSSLLFFYIIVFLSIGIAFAIPIIFKLFIGHEFWPAMRYAYYLLIGYFISGVHSLLQPYLMFYQKNRYIMSVAIIGMLVSLSGNFILVPKIGAFGSVISCISAYFLMVVADVHYVKKLYKLKFKR